MMCIVQTRKHAQNRNVSREGLENAYITTEGGQDKKPHIAARTVGCFVCHFCDFPDIAAHHCNVRLVISNNDVSVNCTLRTHAS